MNIQFSTEGNQLNTFKRALKVGAATLMVAIAATSLTGCARESTSATGDETITIYSGRSEDLIAPLLEQFTAETGIGVEVRYSDSASLAAQILEEGDNVKADVFFSQDAGALGAISQAGAFKQLNEDISPLVDAKYRSTDNTWIGVSGRSRVLSYNPELVTAAELPKSVFDLADAKWKGKIAIAPTNASFQSSVTAMRLLKGEQATVNWLAAMKENAVLFEKNSQILEAVEAGQVAAGLTNHYYWYERAAEVGEDKMVSKMTWFETGDAGNLINVAGVGVLSDKPEAQTFAKWLLGNTAQTFFVEQTGEYSLTGLAAREGLPALDQIAAPEIDLSSLSTLAQTLELIRNARLTD
jgi:iron(III) transport system substrate-binding protein